MAKNSITDYDKVSANNTDVQSVDISEGCSPSGINNAIREVMADLADVNDGTVALTSPVIGTSLDMNGNDLILDADGDSKIESSTDDTINIISGGTTIATATSGGLETPKNHTATISAPASGSLVLSGIPNWANKITLVTHDLSMDTVNGYIQNRVTVGGSAVTTAIYKYSLFRITDSGTATVQDEGSGDTAIQTDGFGATDNLINYILTFYKVDDYIYKFNGTHYNQQYPSWRISLAGSIETTAAIDGFDITTATGNLDSGKARAFWE